MLFAYDLTIPAGTLAANPAVLRAKLTRGTLIRIDALFPPGPAGLVSVRIRDSLHQIVPANPEGSLQWNDAIMRSEFELEMVSHPYELIAEGWSPSALYSHIVTFHFHLRPIGQEGWAGFMKALFAELPVSEELS